jgi:hypothetical protein
MKKPLTLTLFQVDLDVCGICLHALRPRFTLHTSLDAFVG